jgi:PAS domain S-box-containing protein
VQADRLAHLAAVVDASSDAILSKTLDGTVTSWNASAQRIFGYTADEMIGQSIRRLIPDDLQSEEDEILAKLRAGIFIDHYETVRMTKDRRRLDVSLSISPVKNSDGVIVGASKIVRDITARKQADEELRAARAKFESVFNQSGLFAGIMDVDGNLREVNHLAVEWCGYTREEVLDRPLWQTPWWRGSAEMQARIRAATAEAQAGRVFRETLTYWLADGSERIVDFSLHPIRDELGDVRFLHPTGLDITDRMRAEAALRESEERQAFLVRLGDELGPLVDPLAIEATAAELCRKQLGAARVSYFELDADGRSTVRRYPAAGMAETATVADFPPARALARGRTLAVADASDCPEEDRVGFDGSGLGAYLAVPLLKAGGLNAGFVLGELEPRAWTAGEIALVEDAAKRTWAILERARAEEALRAREAEEREIAIGLQRALLPERLVAVPELAFDALYEAGSDVLEVGGDWYDAFRLPSGRVALTVGDVVGHGLAAAAAMGQMRTALAALAQHADGPGELLTRLDDFLGRSGATDFATVCYAVLDPSTGALEYASAGHPPMLVVSPDGATQLLDGAQSPPLHGRSGHGQRRHAAAELEPGSLLVLYSDGLVERRGESLSAGLARLRGAGSTLVGVPIDEVCDRLVAALGVEASRQDDVAVLAMRLTALAPSSFHLVFPARPQELRALRAGMRTWLTGLGLGEASQNALLLAVGEACANAIEHAYRDRDAGEVSVDITEDPDGALQVVVRDTGRFDPGAPPSEDRGRGTDIMRGLTTDFARESSLAGTTVRFRFAVEEPAPA